MKLTLTILIAASLVSCQAIRESQAARRLDKAQDQFKLNPDSFAGLAHRYFPCVSPVPPDTSVRVDDAGWKEAATQMQDYITFIEAYYDSLLAAHGDTVTIYRERNQVRTLGFKARSIPPVIQYVPKPYPILDSSANQLWRNQVAGKDRTIGTLAETGAVSERGRKWWKAYGLILSGVLLAFIIGWIVAKIYKK